LTASLATEPVESACAPEDLLEGLARLDDPVMLDSAATDERLGRFTILACHPLDVLTIREDKLSDSRGRLVAAGSEQVWQALSHALDIVRIDGTAMPPCEYAPGWIGYIGYEVGRLIERLPSRAPRLTALPDLRLAFYDAILVHDAIERSWQLVTLRLDAASLAALDCPGQHGEGAAAMQQLCRAGSARGARVRLMGKMPMPRHHTDFEPAQYAAAVQRCIDYIAAGDIFQVNMTQRFTLAGAPPATDIYRCLRRRNPAWFAAFMSFGMRTGARGTGVPPVSSSAGSGHVQCEETHGQDAHATHGRDAHTTCAILSSSPELFLRVRGRHVITRPIKGTRPRTGDASTDQAAADELRASPKDNAELAMIIDLMRNDLGRVCRFGTVAVTQAAALEAHPTVFHLVGTVEGTLRDDITHADLLKATFPGGSITGAPKIRAMEIIDELEPCARGPYTGCIGIAGVNGRCEWNIAIRTIVCDGDNAYVHAGGGIVADSSPQGEYQETLDKARALLEAIAMATVDKR